MGISTGMYNYNNTFYTGTSAQPDTLSIFVKSGQTERSFSVYHMHPGLSYCDYVPLVSSLTAIPKIINSVETFFNELSQAAFQANDPHLLECWNAFKNFMRALVALVPIAGNITLVIFDVTRNIVSIEPKITESIRNQQNIAGVASDGKVIFTVDLDRLRDIYRDPDQQDAEYYLGGFRHLCTELLKRESERGSQEDITQLFLRFSNRLNAQTTGNLSGNSPAV